MLSAISCILFSYCGFVLATDKGKANIAQISSPVSLSLPSLFALVLKPCSEFIALTITTGQLLWIQVTSTWESQ